MRSLFAVALGVATVVGCNRGEETGRAADAVDTVVTSRETMDTTLVTHDTNVTVDTTVKRGDKSTRMDTVKKASGSMKATGADTAR